MMRSLMITGTATIVALAGSIFSAEARADAASWQQDVTKLLIKNHNYPRSAQVRGHEGTARVLVTVEPSGAITKVEFTQRTGSEILDREAEKIVEKLNPLPATPTGAQMTFEIPIVWKLS